MADDDGRRRVLCKYFAHGACLKGEHCEYSHDWRASPNNICTFYQKGMCSYGSRCRYDHVKVSQPQALVSPPSRAIPREVSRPPQILPVTSLSGPSNAISGALLNFSSSSRPFLPPDKSRGSNGSESNTFISNGSESNAFISDDSESKAFVSDADELVPASVDPAEQPICSFAAAGNCPYGDGCPHLHGDLCPTCGKWCLHPFRPDEREEHIKLCQKNKNRLDALKASQDIECCVCLDRVLSKPSAAERKFGLLSECDHPFCISCIRSWRSNSPDSGMDVNSTLRACPICRKVSYYVIPSVIWYSSKEEKQEIVDTYKAKLSSIDCRHFNFGNGTCPFGTSCFYKHAYRDGRLEEVVLRHLGSEDGNTVIAKDIRLSDFFGRMRI